MRALGKELKMGGQAVIEGVMMRSEDSWAVAVRAPSGEIVVRKQPWRSIGSRIKILKLPVLRGAVILIETLVLGVKALNFSAEIASAEDQPRTGEKPGKLPEQDTQKEGFWKAFALGGTVVFSLLVGLAVFYYLPLWLTETLGIADPFLFNAVDGALRIAVFLTYLIIIAQWKDIQRVFEYHGAEHQTIAAYERRLTLDWENIRKLSRFHPRCGTSFVLVLLIISIFIFMLFGKPADWGQRFARMLAIPLIGGISYELIKLGDRYPENLLTRIMVAPGLWLQRITTRRPDSSQVEVAAAALNAALDNEGSSREEALALSASHG
ncbi:MAG: hypothetical protein A3F83_00520 [Candidatus Glassbacteria bacterium RIFCSPLOWO2_12_FULL_58_11]|uniref:DUF1385 domain-containing protein n=2 Tax=Candidatus Glassiibacteriota TaxID=1817805 RepID=A0A1F5YPK2_9BACT|nr:MAG: hypothetical protein A2Z86_12005 [Candidatus Glassbacteria bacterium GWA2_58_10]OGG02119.1 MAG: hypothetical protein A3F83_00520 [Candidatus Glassbacteria bacterium RIFCSPLOWO2_12_FULL_58_11]